MKGSFLSRSISTTILISGGFFLFSCGDNSMDANDSNIGINWASSSEELSNAEQSSSSMSISDALLFWQYKGDTVVAYSALAWINSQDTIVNFYDYERTCDGPEKASAGLKITKGEIWTDYSVYDYRPGGYIFNKIASGIPQMRDISISEGTARGVIFLPELNLDGTSLEGQFSIPFCENAQK